MFVGPDSQYCATYHAHMNKICNISIAVCWQLIVKGIGMKQRKRRASDENEDGRKALMRMTKWKVWQ